MHQEIINAEWTTKLDIGNCLLQWKAIAEKAYQEVADGPVFDILVKDDFVSKDDFRGANRKWGVEDAGTLVA